jgi:hypothetical protein
VRYDVIALALLFAGLLWYLHRRHRAQVRASRGSVFSECLALFERYRVTQDDVAFAVLEGRYHGYDVRVEPIVDQIALRKIPSLWLLVTLRAPVPFAGAFDLLARPQNVEFYSPSHTLDHAIALPDGWPAHASLRTDLPDAMPPREVMTRHIGFFADPRAKEMVVTPKGVRLVYQAAQAERSQYMVLRQAEFEAAPLQPELVQGLLDQAIALHTDLVRAGQDKEARNHEGSEPSTAEFRAVAV